MVLEREMSLMEVPIVATSWGLTATMTEVADLPALDTGLGLRNLAERIWTFFELCLEFARLGTRSSRFLGSKSSRREGIAGWT